MSEIGATVERYLDEVQADEHWNCKATHLMAPNASKILLGWVSWVYETKVTTVVLGDNQDRSDSYMTGKCGMLFQSMGKLCFPQVCQEDSNAR